MEADVILKNKMKKQKKNNVEETVNNTNTKPPRKSTYPPLNDDEDEDAKELNELSKSLTKNDMTANTLSSSGLNSYQYSTLNTKADNISIQNGYRDLSNVENGVLSSSLPTNKSLTSLYTQAQQINTNQIQTALNTNSNQPNKTITPINRAINYSNLKLLEPVKHLQEKKSSSNNLNPNEDIKTSRADTHDTTNKNNLKDFDSSSLDPFNDMELKTINDIEELKLILQNHNTTQQEQSDKNNHKMFYLDNTCPQKDNIPVHQTESAVSSNYSNSTTNNAKDFNLDNFGLPKISFVDLDINSNNL